MKYIAHLILAITFGLSSFSLTYAEDVTIPNTFHSGTPALAAEVNANFSAVKVAVDDNAADIDSLQSDSASAASDISTLESTASDHEIRIANNANTLSTLQNLEILRTISFPSHALNVDPDSTIIERTFWGLRWVSSYTFGAYLFIKRPNDYSGGDVLFEILFRTYSDTTTSGAVDFFIRPRSYNSNDDFSDAASLSSTPVNVSGGSGFGRLYEQEFTIPESRLTSDWWVITIQREGLGSTYIDDVMVHSVALSYMAMQ